MIHFDPDTTASSGTAAIDTALSVEDEKLREDGLEVSEYVSTVLVFFVPAPRPPFQREILFD